MKLVFAFVGFCAFLGLAYGQECGAGYFECDNGRCIPERWICDGDNDCGDMSDEPDDCPPCPIGEFLCDNGRCVWGTWICDGDNDCGDGSDEPDPETGMCPACPETLFQCATGRCVRAESVCDGVDDCGDRGDEFDDPEQCPACREGQFRCGTGRCIDPAWICNGRDDCGDRSDEPENPDDCPACNEGQFRCNNGACVSVFWVCNGQNDCYDWSDESEEACPCSDDEVRCSTPPSEEPSPPENCIPTEYVCDEDGIWDCVDGSDEANCTLRSINQTRGKAVRVAQSRIGNKQDKDHIKPSSSKVPTHKMMKKNKFGKGKSYLFQKMIKKYAGKRTPK